MVTASAPSSTAGRLPTVLLALAVGVAFADSSIVVLALPELYGEFDTSIVAVSWVITAYNIVVAAVALGLVPLSRWLPPRALAAAGLVVFAGASVLCGVATTFPVLVGGRCAQGLGAALLLAAALPVLGRLTGSRRQGVAVWGMAATVGAAVGPALGGVLTQLFSWRSIFLIQAPVAAAAVLATVVGRSAAAQPGAAQPGAPGARSQRLTANAGFIFVFGALVGALFLAVLLVVVAWRSSPIAGAALVSTLPLGAFGARRLGDRVHPLLAAVAGPGLLAGGLVGLAFVPGEVPALAAACLVACGVGLGLASSLLGPASVAAGTPLGAAAATIGARHLGFVLGLALIAPVLAADLDVATREAARAGTATVLDADISLRDKVPLSLALRDVIEETPRGRVPDLEAAFADVGDGAAVAGVRVELGTAIADTITRAFRTSFLLAALLGATAVVPALVLARRARAPVLAPAPRPAPWATALVVACALGVVALVGGELASGARDLGRRDYVVPCQAPADPFPQGAGLDGVLQRITLSAVNGAACELGTGREELLLSLSPSSGFGDEVTWDEERLEEALRAGFERAVDDAVDRGDLPGWAATVLRPLLRRAPIDWLLGRLDLGALER